MSTGGRRQGKPNYKKETVINIVGAVKPQGPLGWQRVAILYQQESGESTIRDAQDIKRYFTTKCCCLTHKPTGESVPARLARRANEIWEEILRESGAASYGRAIQADEDGSSDSESEEEQDEEPEAGFGSLAIDPLTNPTAPATVASASVGGSAGESTPAVAATAFTPSLPPLHSSRKRSIGIADPAATDNKSNNCRNSNPRTNAAGAISNLVSTMAQSSQQSQSNQIMQMFMQQSAQAQAQQQMMMQQQQQMMMVLMQAMTPLRSPQFAPTPPPMATSFASRNFSTSSSGGSTTSDHTDDTGDISMTEEEIYRHFE